MKDIFMKKVLFVLFCLCLTGCFSGKNWEERSGTVLYYQDASVNLSELLMEVQAKTGSRHEMTALCYPFFVQQEISYPAEIGQRLGAAFWGHWVQNSLFPNMLFSHEKWQGKKIAVADARRKNIDLIVCGQIVNFLPGGITGKTDLALRIDIYAVESGLRIWSFLQSGTIQNAPEHDYILVKTKKRMPQAPEMAVVQALAASMAKPLLAWE